MGEQVAAQLVFDLAADPDEDHPHLVEEEPFRGHHPDEDARVGEELVPGHAEGEVVHRVAQHPRRGHGEDGAHEQAEQSDEERLAVPLQVREEAPEVARRLQVLRSAAAWALRLRSRAWLARRRRGRFSFSQARA
jgi:hypothetical protein